MFAESRLSSSTPSRPTKINIWSDNMSWPPHGSQGAPLPPSPFAPADDVQAQQFQSAALAQRLQRNANNVRAHMGLPGNVAPAIATPVQRGQQQAMPQAIHPRVAELTNARVEKQILSNVPRTPVVQQVSRTPESINNSHNERSSEQIAKLEEMKRHMEAQRARSAANDKVMMPPPSQIDARNTTHTTQSMTQAPRGMVRGHSLQPAGGAATDGNAGQHGINLPLINDAPLTGNGGSQQMTPRLLPRMEAPGSPASIRNIHVQFVSDRVEPRDNPTSSPPRPLAVSKNQGTPQGNGPQGLAGPAPSGIARQHEETSYRPHASTPVAAQMVPVSSAVGPQISSIAPLQVAVLPQSQIATQVQPTEFAKPSPIDRLKYPKVGSSLLSASTTRSMRQHHSARTLATNDQHSDQNSNLPVHLPDYGSFHESQSANASQTDPAVNALLATREIPAAQGSQEPRLDLSSAFDIEQAFRRKEVKKELKKELSSRFHGILLHLCKVDKSLRHREFRRFLSSLGFTSRDAQREALNVLQVMLRDHRATDTRSEYTTVKRWMSVMFGHSTKAAKKSGTISGKAAEPVVNDGVKKLSLFCSEGSHKLKCGHDRISNEDCGMNCYGSKYRPDIDMRELSCPKCVW
ncbi:hypothetical protein E4T39_04962 [Aureobasidium subglaciale]|nr:hypothetical protein E4T39_04962 [Aureobasidium subglaciale]